MAVDFIQINRPDLEQIELRTNWINPSAIAMVTKHQRGNTISAHIIWISGRSTKLEGNPAKVFLQAWEANYASN